MQTKHEEESQCDNCILNKTVGFSFDGVTSRPSIYKKGGPQPFPACGICPRCNGSGSQKLKHEHEVDSMSDNNENIRIINK